MARPPLLLPGKRYCKKQKQVVPRNRKGDIILLLLLLLVLLLYNSIIIIQGPKVIMSSMENAKFCLLLVNILLWKTK